jgi:hypothetical protein
MPAVNHLLKLVQQLLDENIAGSGPHVPEHLLDSLPPGKLHQEVSHQDCCDLLSRQLSHGCKIRRDGIKGKGKEYPLQMRGGIAYLLVNFRHFSPLAASHL